MSLSVACLGLGRIGAGIARGVANSGYRLIVYNRTRQKTEPLVGAGARAATPREAAELADVVITYLMDDHSLLDNMSGDDGLLAGMRPGAIHIGTSTVTPKATTQFVSLHAKQGSHYIAATFAGHPDHAAAGKLMSFVAGKPELVERCRPILEPYNSKILV
jgi:3-hydroxyisobutyrate dehydrogenase-like beta-hydroxyacid dehydrogenase